MVDALAVLFALLGLALIAAGRKGLAEGGLKAVVGAVVLILGLGALGLGCMGIYRMFAR